MNRKEHQLFENIFVTMQKKRKKEKLTNPKFFENSVQWSVLCCIHII